MSAHARSQTQSGPLEPPIRRRPPAPESRARTPSASLARDRSQATSQLQCRYRCARSRAGSPDIEPYRSPARRSRPWIATHVAAPAVAASTLRRQSVRPSLAETRPPPLVRAVRQPAPHTETHPRSRPGSSRSIPARAVAAVAFHPLAQPAPSAVREARPRPLAERRTGSPPACPDAPPRRSRGRDHPSRTASERWRDDRWRRSAETRSAPAQRQARSLRPGCSQGTPRLRIARHSHSTTRSSHDGHHRSHPNHVRLPRLH